LKDLQPSVRFFFILHSADSYFHRNIHNCGKPSRFIDGASAKAREMIAL
jgi:hypothetical protein